MHKIDNCKNPFKAIYIKETSTALLWDLGALVLPPLPSSAFCHSNKIFLAKAFNLLLSSSLSFFEQTRRKNLSKNRKTRASATIDVISVSQSSHSLKFEIRNK